MLRLSGHFRASSFDFEKVRELTRNGHQQNDLTPQNEARVTRPDVCRYSILSFQFFNNCA